MGQGSTQVSLPQNMYDWIGRAIGKLAQIIRGHPLKLILRMKRGQLQMLYQVCLL